MTFVITLAILVVQCTYIVITMKKTKPFQIRFPEETLEKLKTIASSKDTTSSQIIRDLINDYIKK